MPEYSTVPFDLVHNVNYEYYKLLINGKCHFDDFYESIQKDKNSLDAFDKIISMMDDFSPRLRLPFTKFRHIEGVGRNDVYEFKCRNIRIYVVMQAPDIYVVIGGVKGKQDKTLRWLRQSLNEF